MNEKFTFNQVNEQQSSAYMDGSNEKPTVLVKRTDRRVTVGKLDRSTGDVDFQEDGLDKAKLAIPLAELSDQRQVELAEELAGKPLRDNETVQTSEHEQVTRSLGSEAIRGLRHESESGSSTSEASQLQNGYEDALKEKKRAQQEGRGEDSTYWGQVAGQYAKEYRDLTGRDIKY